MQEENIKFLIDTNVFMAAVKKGWTKTAELVLHPISNPESVLVVIAVLITNDKHFDSIRKPV